MQFIEPRNLEKEGRGLSRLLLIGTKPHALLDGTLPFASAGRGTARGTKLFAVLLRVFAYETFLGVALAVFVGQNVFVGENTLVTLCARGAGATVLMDLGAVSVRVTGAGLLRLSDVRIGMRRRIGVCRLRQNARTNRRSASSWPGRLHHALVVVGTHSLRVTTTLCLQFAWEAIAFGMLTLVGDHTIILDLRAVLGRVPTTNGTHTRCSNRSHNFSRR